MTKYVFIFTAIGLVIGNATYVSLSSTQSWMDFVHTSYDDVWTIFTLWVVFKINGIAPRPDSRE